MLTKNSEIVVYIKKILNKLTSSITRQIPWFEQFEHIFLFEFIQVINQEVKSDHDLPSIYYEILLSLLPSLLKSLILFSSSFSFDKYKDKNIFSTKCSVYLFYYLNEL